MTTKTKKIKQSLPFRSCSFTQGFRLHESDVFFHFHCPRLAHFEVPKGTICPRNLWINLKIVSEFIFTIFTVWSKFMLNWDYEVRNCDNFAICLSNQKCQLWLSSFHEFFNDLIWDNVLDNHLAREFKMI